MAVKEIKVFNDVESALEAKGVNHITEQEAMELAASSEVEEESDDFTGGGVYMPEDAVFENDPDRKKINTIGEAEEVIIPEAEPVATTEDAAPTEDGKRSFKFGENTAEDEQPVTVVEDDVILGKLSDMLGEKFASLDEVKEKFVAAKQIPETSTTPQVELDEELQALLKFKQETGRNLNDYVLYQSLNTSEMDDLNAVRLSFKLEYPELNDEAREELLRDKYRLDEDEYTEREQRIGKAQLQADSAKAKKEIERLRSSYMAAKPKEAAVESQEVATEPVSIFDEGWMSEATKTIDEIDRLEFNVSKDLSLKIGIEPSSKTKLKEANKNIENYFDRYINKDGSWNHELFNAHQAVIGNIEMIVGESYKQGVSKGQQELLNRNTNANPEPPRGGGQFNDGKESIKQSLREIYQGQPKMTVRL